MGNADRRYSRKMRQRRGQVKLKARQKRQAEERRVAHRHPVSAEVPAAAPEVKE